MALNIAKERELVTGAWQQVHRTVARIPFERAVSLPKALMLKYGGAIMLTTTIAAGVGILTIEVSRGLEQVAKQPVPAKATPSTEINANPTLPSAEDYQNMPLSRGEYIAMAEKDLEIKSSGHPLSFREEMADLGHIISPTFIFDEVAVFKPNRDIAVNIKPTMDNKVGFADPEGETIKQNEEVRGYAGWIDYVLNPDGTVKYGDIFWLVNEKSTFIPKDQEDKVQGPRYKKQLIQPRWIHIGRVYQNGQEPKLNGTMISFPDEPVRINYPQIRGVTL